MAHATEIVPPLLDDTELRQWQGLLGLYEHWLALFATGDAAGVEAEITARAAYCRAEIARAKGAVTG